MTGMMTLLDSVMSTSIKSDAAAYFAGAEIAAPVVAASAVMLGRRTFETESSASSVSRAVPRNPPDPPKTQSETAAVPAISAGADHLDSAVSSAVDATPESAEMIRTTAPDLSADLSISGRRLLTDESRFLKVEVWSGSSGYAPPRIS